jgi:ribonucleoside-diphosphate reductase alpha chain
MQVIKRDGSQVEFELEKITKAIFEAAKAVDGDDMDLAIKLAKIVLKELDENFKEKIPSVEDVQDNVEKVLIEEGHARTAKAYILYRHQRNRERASRAMILGEESANKDEDLLFSNESLRILEQRYLQKDEFGNLIETPHAMIERVTNNIAQADKFYGASDKEVEETAEKFYSIMAELKFLPNTPTLGNAGTNSQQLSACFVLPIEDKMKSIFGTLRDSAIIHQRGSGTGFSFSRLRPKGDVVGNHQGVASGPVAFLKVYDSALDIIKQGGIRPGANMAVLRVDHPDILRFIEAKRDKKSLKNFNISVAVTDRFMRAVEDDKDYLLKSPRTQKYVGRLRAKDVFSIITQNAWKTGDPGLIFIDEINRKHPAKHLGEIETTNQCGEAPLLANEGCALGSIDVQKFVKGDGLDWDDFKDTIRTSVHFLDNVIDMNSYPNSKIEKQTKFTRKFGLGVMGFADMLYSLGIKYDSDKGLEMADKLMSFLKDTIYEMSQEIASKRGVCGAWEGSEHQKAGRQMRNISCISQSPTGTRSILADTSAGCEPCFALAYQRTLLSSSELVSVNKIFENVAKKRGFYSPELIRKMSMSGNIQFLKEIPKDVRDVFVVAQDISPLWHIKMQSTIQKYTDNSISKTINFSRTCAIKDVEEAYTMAWKLKCKGITIYRDGSYEDQVINIG